MKERPFFKVEYVDGRPPTVHHRTPAGEVAWEEYYSISIMAKSHIPTAAQTYFLMFASTPRFPVGKDRETITERFNEWLQEVEEVTPRVDAQGNPLPPEEAEEIPLDRAVSTGS